MSPSSRSKSKSSSKSAKEQPKASSKPSTASSTGNGIPASAYNPLSGTFHTLESAPVVSSPPPHSNGRFRNIDETDEHSGSSLGTGAEYDSISNNDSCSGESEDQQKEKTTSAPVRQEAIPGSDNDKRDKIRQKNERKHQRQREKRAQELHERCSGYLMSRKLEALAQQLVAMGFSSERATMALILNEGRVEESVAWLFEGGEEAAQQKDSNLDGGSNLKIDISEELARIAEMEVRFKCTKQEVERVVVACEGDLEKAAETLKAQKQEAPSASPKPEETGDPPVANGVKLAVSVTQNLVRQQAKPIPSVTIQQRRDERDFNYTKAVPTVVTSSEPANKNLQSLRKIQPKSEWARPQVATSSEKRWPSAGSSPSVSYSLASPLQVSSPPAKAEARYVVVGSEVKNLQTGAVREPVIMMQRPQSINAKPNPVTSINPSPPVSAGWYSNSVAGVEIMKSSGGLQHIPTTSLSSSNLSSQQFYQSQYQPFASSPVEPRTTSWGGSWSTLGSASSSLAVPSSLGLFSGWGSTGASGSNSPVDWNTGGSMPQCDYTNIDWTLESTSSSKPNGLWLGLASFMNNSRMYDSWSSATSAGAKPVMRSATTNGVCIAGLQDGGVAATDTSGTSSAGSHEWTSPFAGKDLFSLPRQFVTSPSL
ncbi:PREDICTED: uncharacterized protein LOC104593648 [Nelumbo nucifera]|uniref:Uncharacterized protein LOC104593648 n=1 Tax=Nelumbo nucifera TaxID=4432 RepID=A0A1U7ZE46_NELNU|nr:PREDICTED: uncharacterized protein LOC104593648 [Nelumbo nucifera]XP_010251915.1 PREDICTED: uncharacterized protein LOC104593648 [Nelumbo nucifera]